jgi:hypothetical protein
VRIRVDEMELRRPRQWGGCCLACELYHQLELVKGLLPVVRGRAGI